VQIGNVCIQVSAEIQVYRPRQKVGRKPPSIPQVASQTLLGPILHPKMQMVSVGKGAYYLTIRNSLPPAAFAV